MPSRSSFLAEIIDNNVCTGEWCNFHVRDEVRGERGLDLTVDEGSLNDHGVMDTKRVAEAIFKIPWGQGQSISVDDSSEHFPSSLKTNTQDSPRSSASKNLCRRIFFHFVTSSMPILASWLLFCYCMDVDVSIFARSICQWTRKTFSNSPDGGIDLYKRQLSGKVQRPSDTRMSFPFLVSR